MVVGFRSHGPFNSTNPIACLVTAKQVDVVDQSLKVIMHTRALPVAATAVVLTMSNPNTIQSTQKLTRK